MMCTFILLPSEWVRESFHFFVPVIAICIFSVLMSTKLNDSNAN
jgi:hypothetical protein